MGDPAANEKRVAEHYQVGDLARRIVELVRKPAGAITAAELAPVDEFHLGGRESTEAIAARMQLRSGMRLLDVGCGIGGPARFFASNYDCRVTGIDVTPSFLEAAKSLTETVGLADRVSFRQASALNMPFEDGEFDGAYEFHVGMNLSDKAGVFAEVSRVLRPGATFTIYDLLRTGSGELKFPVPWAMRAGENFLATPDEYRDQLRQAGFDVFEERNRRDFAIEFFDRMRKRAASPDASALSIQLIMGETAQQKLANTLEGILGGVIAPFELYARKKA